jgi:hypothetical protein
MTAVAQFDRGTVAHPGRPVAPLGLPSERSGRNCARQINGLAAGRHGRHHSWARRPSLRCDHRLAGQTRADRPSLAIAVVLVVPILSNALPSPWDNNVAKLLSATAGESLFNTRPSGQAAEACPRGPRSGSLGHDHIRCGDRRGVSP